MESQSPTPDHATDRETLRSSLGGLFVSLEISVGAVAKHRRARAHRLEGDVRIYEIDAPEPGKHNSDNS